MASNIHTQYIYHLKKQKMEENELKISTKIIAKENLPKKSLHRWNYLASNIHNFSSKPSYVSIFKNFISSFRKKMQSFSSKTI